MVVTPYNAPEYFPASYFYGAPAAEEPFLPTGPTPYNAPTYFPASYFYGAPAVVVPSTPAGPTPYNAPTYFASSFFYGAPAAEEPFLPAGPTPYNAPTYFPASYFYGAPAVVVPSTPAGPTPYNAPTYFPSSYFYGVPAVVVPSTPAGPTPYNAPTYFPSSYFYGVPTPPVEVPVVTPVVPDLQWPDQPSYLAMLGLLDATGVFEDVIFGAANQRSQAGADTYPLAIVTPKGWEESDDFDPVLIIRRATFSITIVVKDQDGFPRFDLLDSFSSAVKGVVDRSSLGGTCLPALTRIRAGRYEYSNHHPEQSIDLEGEFSSIVDPLANVPAPS